ncbi:MAG TPA: HAD family hydrolase [Kofleriaceae bacterium]|nr:HAD family hydrolase [Kofleriaceae bacterium]
MQIRAVVFDLDGTLVDSLDDIANALAAALADHQLPAPSREAVRDLIGGGARNLIVRTAPADRVDDVLARFNVHYAAAPISCTILYDGISPVLDRLAASHRTLAVLTNKPHEIAVKICDELLAPWPFAVVAGHRRGAPLKPSPEGAWMVAAELGVPPEACALVGDAGTDIDTARAAGMMPVAVTWGYRPREELVAKHPALLVDDPAELQSLAF